MCLTLFPHSIEQVTHTWGVGDTPWLTSPKTAD